MRRQTHKHAVSDRKRIDTILELNLGIWSTTRKLKRALGGKITRKALPIKEAKYMAALDDALVQLKQTVADSISAQDAAIKALGSVSVTKDQIQAITDASAALTAETAKLTAATPAA